MPRGLGRLRLLIFDFATTTTTTTSTGGGQRRLRLRRGPISFIFRLVAQGEEPPDTGGGRVFSFDATFGLLATADAVSAGAILVLSAQLLWYEAYDMQN